MISLPIPFTCSRHKAFMGRLDTWLEEAQAKDWLVVDLKRGWFTAPCSWSWPRRSGVGGFVREG